jgi:hypothetical protein
VVNTCRFSGSPGLHLRLSKEIEVNKEGGNYAS